MKTILLTVLIIVVVGSLFFWNSRPRKMSPDEVKSVLISWLNNDLNRGEWDSFQCIKIKNIDLENIRMECMDIYQFDSEYLCEPKIAAKLNELGRERVKGLVEKVERLVKIEQSAST